MSVRYLNIEAKHRREGGFLADLNDFTVSEGEAADAGVVLANPNLSLYCFDDEAKRAILSNCPVA
jgi:hypothetical protein